MASKLKREVGTTGKGKEKASSSSMDVQHCFKDHTLEELERYRKYYQKKIVQTPKYGDLSSFPEECFNFQDKLISLGLEALITSSGPYYPYLVRMFYCNMCIENGKFVTHVRGKKIALGPKRLGQILDIPSGGHMISEGEYHEKRVESHDGEEPPKDFWSAGNFFINDRLLHYFLAYVILPRNSNHCTVTDMEMQALYAIKNDIILNWSRLILHHMMTYTNKLKYLPYVWFITHIMEYFNVDFDDVEYCLMDTRSHKISIKNVDKRMGYRYNPETKSVMFIGGNNEENEKIPQEGDGGEDVPPPSGLSNQDLFDFMTTQFSNLHTSINDQWISANNQIALNHEATTNRINLLQTDTNQHFSYLYSHLNIPPYDPNNTASPAPIYTPIRQQFPYQGNSYNNTNNDMDQP
ncbi:hypothetical protein KIW84_042057 [Lathyrus oleraceus]|uniref:Putative plant transposon protein domain-containing protein n=1 Tax=Pisum sativum TaxID=3888 RepID=A0A9D4XA23_PEA|nr:hypothetical protein KIW84_042057 [Pisum sativum]